MLRMIVRVPEGRVGVDGWSLPGLQLDYRCPWEIEGDVNAEL